MKKFWIGILLFCACNARNPQEPETGAEQAVVSPAVNVLDSLQKRDDLGELVTRVYRGELLADSIGVDLRTCTLTLYHYEHSGDGVYSFTQEVSGQCSAASTDTTRTLNTGTLRNDGRMYTLRGDAQNPDAVVYQLRSFSGEVFLNFLYQRDTLVQLNKKMERLSCNLIITQ